MYARESILYSELTHIVLQDNRGRNLIDQPLVFAARLLLYTAVEDGLVSQYRRKPLVKEHDGHIGHGLSPPPDKLLHTPQILARFAIGLRGASYYYLIDLLALHILLEKVKKFVSGHGAQAIGNNAQGVGHSQPRALTSIVDRQDSSHRGLLSKQPSVRILRAQLVAALNCR